MLSGCSAILMLHGSDLMISSKEFQIFSHFLRITQLSLRISLKYSLKSWQPLPLISVSLRSWKVSLDSKNALPITKIFFYPWVRTHLWLSRSSNLSTIIWPLLINIVIWFPFKHWRKKMFYPSLWELSAVKSPKLLIFIVSHRKSQSGFLAKKHKWNVIKRF